MDWPFTNLGMQFFTMQLPMLMENIGKLADELKRYNDAAEKNPHTQPENAEAYIAAAKKQWAREGEIEIDAEAKVSVGDDPGAYVQAWVWVYDVDADLHKKEQ
jgi:hypothetical protein